MTLDELNILMQEYRIQQITLDFYNSSYNTIPSKQLDNCRYILCTLTENGTPRNVKSNEKPRIRLQKPDNTYVYNDCDRIEDGRVLVRLTEQILAVNGKAVADIQLTSSDGNIYSTKNFIINIDSTPYQNDAIESSNEFDALNGLIDEVTVIIETGKEINKNEEVRIQNEKDRIENENKRLQNEESRKNAEAIRISNEEKRQNNETIRQNQEADRQTNTATAISNTEDATKKANDAANDLQAKLDAHHFVVTEDKDIAGGVPSLDANTKIPISELYEATTTSKGITQLTDSVASTSTTTAATPNSVKTVNDALTAEKERSANAEKTLTDNLNSEISRAKSAESTITTNLNNETTRATTKENEIATNLSNEVTRATTAEDNLDTKKANIASPTFTGTPKAPTANTGTNTTQIATTAFTQSAVSNHNSSTTAHSDIRDLISGLTERLNALADSDDTTLDQLSEIVAYIKSNRTLIESITTDKVSVSDIIDNLTSTSISKPLSANQGKVLNDLIAILTATVDTKIDTVNGDSYIGTSKTGTTEIITHKDVVRTNTTSTVSPSHGGTFTTVKSVSSDAKGHITGVDTETVILPSQYAHPNYTARTGVPTANQTPTFGGTFNVSQPVSDSTGHITAINSRTVTIPNTVATQTSAGLESASDKKKLDGIETGAEVNVIDTVKVNGTALTPSSKAIDIEVPTNNNQLTNGAGYITESNLTPINEAISTLNSNLSFKYNILTNDDISNTSFVDSLFGIVLYNSDITIVNVTVHMIKTITKSVWITQNNQKLPQPLSDCMYVKFYADGNAWFFIQNKGVVIGNAEGEKTYSVTLIYKNA